MIIRSTLLMIKLIKITISGIACLFQKRKTKKRLLEMEEN